MCSDESLSGVVFECLSLQHSWCLLSYPKVALGVNCFSFFFYTVLRERILEVETASREKEALLIATTHFDIWVKFCCSCCLVAKSCMTLCDPMDLEDSIKKLILIRVLKIIQRSFTFLIFPFQELISQVKPINLTLILTKLRAVSTFLSPSVFKTPLVGKVLDP